MVIAVQIAMKTLTNVTQIPVKMERHALKALLVNIAANVLLVSKEIIVKLILMNVSWIPVFSTQSVRIPALIFRSHLANFIATVSNLSDTRVKFAMNVQMVKVETTTGNADRVNSLKSITSRRMGPLVLIRNAQTGLE
tara:strand:- start:214 stop:627 length:414 start_codon:yes stop_codon:yes gene_type:complete